MDVPKPSRRQSSTLPIPILAGIMILLHVDLLPILRDPHNIRHMTRSIISLRDRSDNWRLANFDFCFSRRTVPILRIAPVHAPVVIVKVEIFVCYVDAPCHVAGALASRKEPLVVAGTVAGIGVFVFTREEEMAHFGFLVGRRSVSRVGWGGEDNANHHKDNRCENQFRF